MLIWLTELWLVPISNRTPISNQPFTIRASTLVILEPLDDSLITVGCGQPTQRSQLILATPASRSWAFNGRTAIPHDIHQQSAAIQSQDWCLARWLIHFFFGISLSKTLELIYVIIQELYQYQSHSRKSQPKKLIETPYNSPYQPWFYLWMSTQPLFVCFFFLDSQVSHRGSKNAFFRQNSTQLAGPNCFMAG